MITVAGGTYYERCLYPDSNDAYGSGLRAAAALSGLDLLIALHTYVDEGMMNLVEAITNAFSVTLTSRHRQDSIKFSYYHGLSCPRIFPERYEIHQELPFFVEADTVLRFGMIEGVSIVKGKRVVYDPQSAVNPLPFAGNGSHAEQLAMVLNFREGVLLTGKRTSEDIIDELLLAHNCEVVVLKRGPLGCIVATRNSKTNVPAFKTPSVWPIGSGDVFSAAFTYYWAHLCHAPEDAALLASKTAAVYCSSRTLPLDLDPTSLPDFEPVDPNMVTKDPTVYLAGPFFTMGQRWMVEEARMSLFSAGVKVFSPFHDIGRGSAEDVAPADIEGIKRSHALFAIVDGLDPGTLFEIGYARSLGIPVIALVENEKEEDLKMLTGSGCTIASDFPTAIYKAAWACLES